MRRIPKTLVGIAGLGLMLSACVPLDVAPADPTASSTPPESALPPHDAAASPVPELPLLTSPADGLPQRIAALHASSVAYQLQEGKHPIDYAVPGSERVLLAERFSQGMRFELPEKQSGDSIIVEMTCSEEINVRFEAYDAKGRSVGSGRSSCSPHGPSGFGFGFLENRRVGEIEVSYVQESDVELSVTTFTSFDQEQPSGN